MSVEIVGEVGVVVETPVESGRWIYSATTTLQATSVQMTATDRPGNIDTVTILANSAA